MDSFNLIELNKYNNKPEIKYNKTISSINEIDKHIGTIHGYSIIAVNMLDPDNTDMQITIKYNNKVNLYYGFNQLIKIIQAFIPITTYIRSYVRNNELLEKYKDIKLEKNNDKPSHVHDYKGRDVLVDIIEEDELIKMLFYRCNEKDPREILLMSCS